MSSLRKSSTVTTCFNDLIANCNNLVHLIKIYKEKKFFLPNTRQELNFYQHLLIFNNINKTVHRALQLQDSMQSNTTQNPIMA